MSRNRFLVSVVASAVTLALAGPDALALGLGGIRIQSALNQPFVGEIDLLDVKPDELDTVKAQLAPSAEFDKAGAERYHYLTKLRFSPQLSPRGSTVIRVTSREPIREPYMDFLVETLWPKGRLVRQYTLLLDPPATAGRAAPRLEPPVTRQARAETPGGASAAAPASAPARPQQAPPPPPAAERAPAAPPPAAGGGFPKRFGPVRSGVGLWRLSLRGNPPGATVAQTAMALYRNNQGAFIGGDINRVIVGKTLSIPSSAELLALDPDAAKREYEAALRGEKVRRAPMAPAGPLPEEGASRLKIAGTAPQEARPGPAGAPGVLGAPETPGTAPAQGEGVEKELLLVRETSESAHQEAVELRDRVHELEDQLTEIQQLLKLRNAQLARIQGAPATGAPGAEPLPGHPAPLPADLDAALKAGGPAGPELAAGGPAVPAEAPKAAAPRTAPAATGPGKAGGEAPAARRKPPESKAETKPESKPGEAIWPGLMLPLAGLAGLSALGLGGFLWWRNRRRRVQEPSLEPISLEVPEEAALGVLGASAPAAAPAAQGAGSSAFADISRTEAETDEADAISEADIYIAYGRYREAEELLRDEIRRAPNRMDLKLKLAEAYMGARNQQALKELMDEMRSAGVDRMNPDQWQRLVNMSSAKEARQPASALSPVSAPGGGAIRPARPAGSGVNAGSDLMDSFELGSKETFSLDLGEGGGPSDESPAPGGRGGLADLGAPRQPKAAAKAATSVLPPSEDRLLFDDEGLDERFDLQRDSERIQIDSRAVSLRERGVRDAVSELDMTIEDLRAATDMDLDTFVDSSPASGLVEEQERARGGQRAKGPALRSVSTETGVRGEPTDLHGISASQGDSPSSDLLSSQWQMDSGLWDETATKLDLARAYVEMGDKESARGILDEVVSEGNDSQCAEAKALLRQLG